MATDWLDQIPMHISGEPYALNPNARTVKTMNDNIHGSFDMRPICVSFMDTQEFQRLQHLKQLGLTNYVYRGATHTRFIHSVGVSHLANTWCNHLLSHGCEEGWGPWGEHFTSREWRKRVDMVTLAGLCHDLGHGPFSHVFEHELLPRVVGKEAAKHWKHEKMSEVILDHLIDNNHIDLQVLAGIEPVEGAKFIKSLVAGGPMPPSKKEEAWLWDIVANKRNGVDVDKFDYLVRDAAATGTSVSLDFQRLMLKSRVVEGQIAFRSTEYENIHRSVFGDRAVMHSKVYTHRKAKSVEFLVCDALAMAAPELGLNQENLGDVEQYLRLNDGVMERLMWLDPEGSEQPERVRAAQALLGRLEGGRRLYVYVDEFMVHKNLRPTFQRPSPQDLVYLQESNGTNRFTVHDVVVCDIRINYSMGERNPLDNVLFWGQPDGPGPMQQELTSSILPSDYEDYKVRVYSRSRDPAIVDAIREAFRNWIQNYNRSQAGQTRLQLCTPMKPRSGLSARALGRGVPVAAPTAAACAVGNGRAGGLPNGAGAAAGRKVAAAGDGWERPGDAIDDAMEEDSGSQPPSRKRQRNLAKHFGSITDGKDEGAQEQEQ